MSREEGYLVFDPEGFTAYFKLIGGEQTSLPGINPINDWFAWELDKGISNTSTDTVSIIKEEKAFMVDLNDLPIVRAVTVEYKGDYKIYRVIINYNNSKEEMEMLEKLNEIYDELGDDNIVVEYDPIPDEDLERAKRKGLTVLTE